MEPGQAIEWALQVVRPFTIPVTLDPELTAAIAAVGARPEDVLARRVAALAYWEQEAVRLLPVSIERIRAVPDPHLQALLLGGPVHEPPVLGKVCHVRLC